MNKNKEKTLIRKTERKIKILKNKAGFDINTLKREIYSYQFNFLEKPSWNQSFPVEENKNNVLKIKDQQRELMGGKRMINKRRYIVSKKITEDEKQKMKDECKKNDMDLVKEESCDVQYNSKSCVIYAVDGSLVQLNKEEGRIIFIQTYPHFKSEKSADGKERIRNKIVCEIRMPASLFRITAYTIMDEINDYERHEKKKAPLVDFLKKEQDHFMFG